MAYPKDVVDSTYRRAETITGIIFFLFALVMLRQGSSRWFNMSRHPNWVPDIGTLLVILISAVVVISTLGPMMANVLTGTSLLLGDASTMDTPYVSLAVVATAFIVAWGASSTLFFYYGKRVQAHIPAGQSVALFDLMWIPMSIIYLYALTGGTIVWTTIR
jgi:hypothetical protein